MPTCTKCEKDKPAKAFSKRSNGKLRRHCRACVNAYSRAVYRADPQRYAASRYKHKKRRREVLRELIWKAKSVPCADCGGTFPPVVMDFDHREGETKVGDISTLVGSGRKAAVLAEIAKCDVVCANCHRVRTYG